MVICSDINMAGRLVSAMITSYEDLIENWGLFYFYTVMCSLTFGFYDRSFYFAVTFHFVLVERFFIAMIIPYVSIIAC